MVKSYKAFIKEYSMGLQVPSTSYLKGVGSLNKLTKKETSTNNTAMDDSTPAPVIALPKKKNEVSDKLKGKVLDRKIARAKVKFKSKAFLSKP
jgi:hypothetical protein|tara:strand:+ start:124 stop:402 length:279 start_codon:yes stop_codon:yes gene_type:complete